MDFQPNRMKQLIDHDHFLSTAYDAARKHFHSDEETLQYLFEKYVQNEPIIQNAYHLLTEPSLTNDQENR